MKGMSPKLRSDNGEHVLIRPLAYVAEDDLEEWARLREFPIIPCDQCGSQETLQRKQVKQMLRDWEREHPGRTESMFRAMSDVVGSHLMDRKLFDFEGLKSSGGVDWTDIAELPDFAPIHLHRGPGRGIDQDED